MHESQSLGGPGGGRTPYGGRTPGRTPAVSGMATPGHMSMRHVGRTPNPYGGQTVNPAAAGAATPAVYNGAPGFGMPTPTPFGYQTPSGFGQKTPASGAFGQPLPPGGMNPQRAAMIQDSSTWGAPSLPEDSSRRSRCCPCGDDVQACTAAGAGVGWAQELGRGGSGGRCYGSYLKCPPSRRRNHVVPGEDWHVPPGIFRPIHA